MAQNHEASRYALVEFSIQRLKPVIEQDKSKQEIRNGIDAGRKGWTGSHLHASKCFPDAHDT